MAEATGLLSNDGPSTDGPSTDGIVTPEAVVLDFETAGLASRLLSGLIDVTIQFVLLVLVMIGAAGASGVLAGSGVAEASLYVLVFLVLFGYPVALETLWRGRTVGKSALGLRVVTVNGLPVRFRHAAIRSMLGLIDKWIGGGAVGIIVVLLTRRNQRVGDLVAGTIVLRERQTTAHQGPVAFRPPPQLAAYCASLDVTGLSQRDYVAIRSFLLRAHTLPPSTRNNLARAIAMPLHERLRSSVPDGMHPEVWLACLLAAQQARNAPVAAGRASSVWDLAAPASPPRQAPPPSTPPAGGYVAPG